jgi:hypothetical protein
MEETQAGTIEFAHVQSEGDGDLELLNVGAATVRKSFFSFMREQFQEDIDAGILPRQSASATVLLDVVDLAECYAHLPLCDVPLLLQRLSFGATYRCRPVAAFMRFVRDCKGGVPFGRWCFPVRRVNAIFDLCCLVCLIDAHVSAQQRIMSLVGVGTETSVGIWMLGVAVVAESARCVEQIKQFLAINGVNNDFLVLVRTQQLAFSLIQAAEQQTLEWLRVGVLHKHDVSSFNQRLRADRCAVWWMVECSRC